MNIEIRKAGFVNKGAELMLYAVLDTMKKVYPDANFVMTPNLVSAPYKKRAAHGFYQKADLWYGCIQCGVLAGLIPEKIRIKYGIILDKEIDIVVDAAGFAYSDQMGMKSSLQLANSCKRWKKKGTKIILLPQAFGPFTSPKIKDCMKIVAESANLIFPRDRISYDYLVGVVGEQANIKMAPDFTNLLEGIVPNEFNRERNSFCVIPNYRMIDMTTKEQKEAYLPFMVHCVQYLLEKDKKPFILIHEGADDLILAEKIRKAVGETVAIIKEVHPLKIKGILGKCAGTISSRFHGLVSALSQGVPSLGTGWSHKYQMLFEDYDFLEGLVDVTSSENEIRSKIDLIISPDSRQEIKEKINENSFRIKKLSNQMWDEVFDELN